MSGQADIRKWFLKKPDHDKLKSDSAKPPDDRKLQSRRADDGAVSDKVSKAYKKESKFFAGGDTGGMGTLAAGDMSKLKSDKKGSESAKRKSDVGIQEKPTPKKPRLVIPASDDLPVTKEGRGRKSTDQVADTPPVRKETETPAKSQSRGSGNSQVSKEKETPVKTTPARGRGRGKIVDTGDHQILDGDGEEASFKTPVSVTRRRGNSSSNSAINSSPEKLSKTPASGGRGRGRGRGEATDEAEDDSKPSGGRGRGRGAWVGGVPPWLKPRGAPPRKGEKEVPQGAENALAGLSFVISGTLDSLEREEAEILIKSHGGRVASSVSKKTDYLLVDEDIGGSKSKKAKDLGVKFLTEDGLFAILIASNPKPQLSKSQTKTPANPSRIITQGETKGLAPGSSTREKLNFSGTGSASGAVNSPVKRSVQKDAPGRSLPPPKPGKAGQDTESWPNKHRPKSSADIIGNPGIVKQLKDWLQHWEASFLHPVGNGKGKKRGGGSSSGGGKKAVLLSGIPGIGKTTTARLVCKELGFEPLEVNASDSRGKADSKIRAGMGGSTANTIKEMVNNKSINFSHRKEQSPKSVLIMDEVDGMSGGDRGGVTDLIASIKSSRVPIICICNDKYSQKLKSLQNYCLPLAYRKPTKQQMAKRLLQVAKVEGLQVDEVTLEDIAERTNGDMRMALNQLQYMSLRTRTLKFADVHSRLLASSKDEDITPFSAADKLLAYESDRLRMDERVDLHMSDADLVPLLIQENYLNFVPNSANQDQSGVTLMDLVSRAAQSIAEGDIINVQIRRRQQWQHSQAGAFMSSIIPAALMHGRRMEFEGGRNFNRFPGWLGKNSSFGKKVRLLEDVHIHLLASRICEPTREAIRMGYVPLLALNLSHPLRTLPKEAAVEEVAGLMDEYSLTQDDYETIMEISKFKGHPDPLEGVPTAVKSALTKLYKQRERDRPVRTADLLPPMVLPGQRKTKKPARLKLTVGEEGADEELGDDGEADEEEGEEDAAEDNDNLESLLNSNGTAKVTLELSKQKGASVQRGGPAKSKASESKTPKKTELVTKASSSAGPSAGKRKR